jgi:hypothetical protein
MVAGPVFAAGLVAVAGWIALWAIELSQAREVRLLPRWAWALLCMFCIPAGALAYLSAGRVWHRRPRRRRSRQRGYARRVTGAGLVCGS